jgi:hypothetical protein
MIFYAVHYYFHHYDILFVMLNSIVPKHSVMYSKPYNLKHYIKPCSKENASQRKFELASRLNTNLQWLAITLNTLKFLHKLRRLAINLRVLAIRLNGRNASYHI